MRLRKLVGQRYGQRSGKRLPGHPGSAYVPELIELARRAEPCRLGPVMDIDTTTPIELDRILAWVTDIFEQKLGV